MKVSVIIPVFNSERYLRQCLESVLSQSMQDFEIICVDDGSTDGSLEILDGYSAADNRFVVIRQIGKGGGAARNRGMDVARGEYLYFLDSDDWIDRSMLESLVFNADAGNSDLVVSGVLEFSDSTGEEWEAPWMLRSDLLPKEEVFSGESVSDCVLSAFPNLVWNKLFRRSFVQGKGIRFQEIPRANDLFFASIAAVEAQRISIVENAMVHHRVGSKDSCQSTNDRYPLGFIEAFSAVGEYLRTCGKLDLFEHDFANQVVDALVYNLDTLTTYESYAAVYYAFRERLEKPFALNLHSEDYFRDARQFSLYKSLRDSRSPEEGIFFWNKARFLIFKDEERLHYDAESRLSSLQNCADSYRCRAERAELDLEDFKSSRSFRLGWALTSPARHLKDMLSGAKGSL